MTTAGTRRRKKRRLRERSLAAAVVWSALTTILLGLTAFSIEIVTPGTPLRNFWDLVVVNGQVRGDNPLIAQFMGQIRVADVLGASFVSVFGGGIALGRLAPRSRARRTVLWAAVILTAANMLLWVGLGVKLQMALNGGRFAPGTIDGQLVATQSGWTVVWALTYAAGTLLGLRWRDRRPASGSDPELPARTAASGSRP